MPSFRCTCTCMCVDACVVVCMCVLVCACARRESSPPGWLAGWLAGIGLGYSYFRENCGVSQFITGILVGHAIIAFV